MFQKSSLTPVVFCLVFACLAGVPTASAQAFPLDGDPIAAPTCEEENPENPEVCQTGDGIEPIEIEPDKAVWTPKAPSGRETRPGGDLAARLASWLQWMEDGREELASRLRSLGSGSAVGAGGR